MTKAIAPYGSWPSAVSAEMVAGRSVRLGMAAADGETLYWSESRPMEQGRGVIVCRTPDGKVRDILPAPWSARSGVHEYGGGEFAVAGGTVYFVNQADQDIYAVADGEPRRVTDAPGMRFADMAIDRHRNRLVAVAERHRMDHDPTPENLLVAVDLDGPGRGEITELAQGRDFYAAPAVSPDGDRLAWLEWSLPHMPWESAELRVGQVGRDGTLDDVVRVAGGRDSAAFQPEWDEDGGLWFVWDGTGWGNLHRWTGGEPANLTPRNAEFGRPLWGLGTRSYAVMPDGRAFASFMEEGRFRYAVVDREGGVVPAPISAASLDAVVPLGRQVGAAAGFDDAPPAVVVLSPDDGGGIETVRSSAETALAPGDVSAGRPVSFPGEDGTVHAIHYPPTSAGHAGPDGGLPPAVVLVHGGPTGYADRGLKLKTQYWTTHGFAVLDVDFTGSFGYGRAYRKALDGHWGLRDAADAAAAARWLGAEGLADPHRVVISGGSSGGYTALSALVHHDDFAGAASYYGISDVALLARTTHKFESGYTESLTGIPADAPDEAYGPISPIAHADRITRPVILFQGDQDKVVPPEQSIAIARSLKARGVPVWYVEYPGEGHGFRQAPHMIDAIRREHAFYARILGLDPPEDLPDLDRPNAETT